jgi:hypothetical protein
MHAAILVMDLIEMKWWSHECTRVDRLDYMSGVVRSQPLQNNKGRPTLANGNECLVLFWILLLIACVSLQTPRQHSTCQPYDLLAWRITVKTLVMK